MIKPYTDIEVAAIIQKNHRALLVAGVAHRKQLQNFSLLMSDLVDVDGYQTAYWSVVDGKSPVAGGYIERDEGDDDHFFWERGAYVLPAYQRQGIYTGVLAALRKMYGDIAQDTQHTEANEAFWKKNMNAALLKAAMAISEALSLLEIDQGDAKDPVALKTAYRGAARKNHPDVGGNAEVMKKINEAYELLSEGGGSMADEPEEDDWSGAKATAILNEKLTPFKKGHAWWMPPYNLAINTALSTMNCWEFTILPMFASRQAYRAAAKGKPEGMVIDPNWASVKNLDIGYGDTGKLRSIIDKLPTIDTIEDTIKAEIASVEKHFNVTVPPEVRAYLLKEMPKAAIRRWGGNRLRRKKVLVPFDGSKPIELGSWD